MKKLNYIFAIVILLLIQHTGIAQQYVGFDLANTDAYSLKNRSALFSQAPVLRQKDNIEPDGKYKAVEIVCGPFFLSVPHFSQHPYRSPKAAVSLLCFSTCIQVRAPSYNSLITTA